MTVRTLLIIGATSFFALLVAAFLTSVVLVGDESSGARVVGLTNRQGLLSQKVAKEALAYARSPSATRLNELRNSMRVFSVTQRALRFGGTAPLDLEGLQFGEVSGAKDPEVQRYLQQASLSWGQIVDAVERLIVAAQLRSESMSLVEVKNARLTRKIEDVAQVLKRHGQLTATYTAGRLAGVAERTVKAALLYDTIPGSTHEQRLKDAIAAFEATYKSLRRKRLWKQNKEERVRMRQEVNEKLDEARWLWLDQSEAMANLASENYHQATVAITEVSPKLLKTLGAAALRADRVVAQNVEQWRWLQLLVLAFGVLMATAAIVFAIRIGASLRRLRDVAESISRGQADAQVEVVGIGEIRDLSLAFERMRRSLGKAMELVERATAATFAGGRSSQRSSGGRES